MPGVRAAVAMRTVQLQSIIRVADVKHSGACYAYHCNVRRALALPGERPALRASDSCVETIWSKRLESDFLSRCRTYDAGTSIA